MIGGAPQVVDLWHRVFTIQVLVCMKNQWAQSSIQILFESCCGPDPKPKLKPSPNIGPIPSFLYMGPSVTQGPIFIPKHGELDQNS